MNSYKNISAEVDAISDGRGMPIDRGIKKLVIALIMRDFPTDGSCEGHLNHGLPYPWVEIYAPEQEEREWIKANKSERQRLTKIINEFYKVNHSNQLFSYQNIGIFGGFRLIPRNVSKQKPSKESLRLYGKDFNNLADYLIATATTDN